MTILKFVGLMMATASLLLREAMSFGIVPVIPRRGKSLNQGGTPAWLLMLPSRDTRGSLENLFSSSLASAAR
jgi:hypothetical protein